MVFRPRHTARPQLWSRLRHVETHSSPLQLRAWRGFLTAHARLVAQLEDELAADADLALTWYEVLLLLRESAEGGLRMHELADSRLLSRSAATRLIDRMEAAGLVHRRAAEVDRRGTYVELSDEGLAALRRAAPVHLRGIGEHFTKHLDDEESAVVERVTMRIVAALESGNGGV